MSHRLDRAVANLAKTAKRHPIHLLQLRRDDPEPPMPGHGEGCTYFVILKHPLPGSRVGGPHAEAV